MEELQKTFEKDEYGLYIYASNYPKMKSEILVSEILNL